MNLNIRRFNFAVLIIVFSFLAAFILLYNLGWRYNLKEREIIKTGILTIKSSPKNALIYINNKDIRKVTPTIIGNLIPGDYELQLKKQGYFDWQKPVTIYPSLATIYDNVFLLKQPVGTSKIFNLPVNNLLFSDNADQVFLVVQQKKYSQLWLLDLSNWQSQKLYETENFQIKNIKQSSHLQNILIQSVADDKNDYLIINKQNPAQFIKLADIVNYPLTNLKWDQNNDNIIYGSHNEIIYKIDLSTLSSIKLADIPGLIDFWVDQNFIYIVDQKSFSYFDINKPVSVFKIADMTAKSNPYFLQKQSNFLLMLDGYNQILYLLDTNLNLLKTIDGVKIASLNAAADKLLYYNDFEIWVYNIKNDQRQMLTRISHKINEAQWHSSNAYIIFSSNNVIQAIENDLYNPNLYKLLTVDIKQFVLDKDGKNVLWLTNDGQLERINIF